MSIIKWWRACNSRMVLPVAVAVALALIAPRACVAQDSVLKGRVFALPMDYDPLRIPYPIVHVKINGSEPLPFVLDTGCSAAVVVTETTQKELHLSMTSERTNDSFHTNVRYREARLTSAKLCAANPVNDIELSSAGKDGLHATILPGKVGQMLDQYKIAGLIGLPLLKPFTVARLDFARKVLILGFYGDLAETVKDAAELPITLQADGRLHVTAQVAPGGSADMVVDTGSPSTLVSDDLAYLSGFTLTDTSTYTNVAGMHQVFSGVLARLDLGKFTETAIDCEIPNGEPNLLGADLLSRYLVLFDLGNNKMYLARSSDYTERIRSRGAQNIWLSQKDGRMIIDAVSAGSAAAQAGVQKGDELLSVNGAAVQALPALSAHLLVDGYAGEKTALDLVRHGEVVHAAYTIESATAARVGGAAIRITLPRGGKLVFPDSAGLAGAGRTSVVDPGKTVTITPGTTVIANGR